MTTGWTDDDLEPLLGRPVRARVGDAERDAFAGRRVLITGAGGTIGSAIARELAKCQPDRIGLVDQSEHALFSIERELRGAWPGLRVDVHLADVTRRASMLRACRDTSPDVVYHAAAYKHVTMAERAPAAAAHVNVAGTAEAAQAARTVGARFVLISSDKAADPRGVMGATKRLAEIVALEAAAPGFRPIVVRFGNVLGSSGSVLEIMQDCVARGVPSPLTDPGATRYFMTPGEAVALVLRADLLGRAAEIFWLEMGRPIRMGDLAARLMVIAAQRGAAPVPIDVVGLRPGEKRNEVLADRRLSFVRTIDRRIRVARDTTRRSLSPRVALRRLRAAMATADDAAALEALVAAVEGFEPSEQACEAARRARLLRTSDAARASRRRRAAA